MVLRLAKYDVPPADTFARWMVDPVTIASVACLSGVIITVADANLFGVAMLAALVAGWSSAWSP